MINIYKIRMINLYISILEENQNELIEIINFVLDFNSNKGIEEGFVFKIIGNQYVTSFIKDLIYKKIVNRRIEYELSLLGDVLFDIYKIRGMKYENKKFIINKTEFNITDDYLNLYFLIARLSLNNNEYNLVKEFEKKIKNEKSEITEFNFYFSKRELGLFEKIDTEKIKELNKFKNLLKSHDFYCEDYYDYNEFINIFKKKLKSLAFKQQKKVFKEKKKIMNKLANSNLTDIFYSFVVLEKYRGLKDVSEKENKYITRFLSEEQYSINKFNQEFGQDSFQETVKFIINEGMANPNEEEFDNVMNRLIKHYGEKDFRKKSTEKLEKYLKNNGILDNKKLENDLDNNDYISSIEKDDLDVDDKNTFNIELDLFGLLKSKTSENIYPILEYLKKYDNLTLNNTLKNIYDDMEDILGSSYLLYTVSFFHDLKPEFELLQEYYINSLDKGVIDQFYHDEWQNDDLDEENLEEELFEDMEIKSIEEEFIITTNDFLEEWNSYYKLFRNNILQKEDNLKFIYLMILSIDNNKEMDKNILNLKLLIKYIFNEINELINVLDDLKFLNDQLENLKDKEMKNQYNNIRKFINKWRRNISSFKRVCKIHLGID
ncbi:MAG: hypothetical protein LBT10_01930 [Methanobrevibacter sp.]|nr:hypothetical protein [Methanobrevibacter sp.]